MVRRNSRVTGGNSNLTTSRMFILMFVIGPAIGIILSILTDYSSQYSKFTIEDFIKFFPVWFDQHSFIAVFGGIFIITMLLFGMRYTSGVMVTMETLGKWGSITGIFFTMLSYFLLTKLNDEDLKWMLFNPLDSFVAGTFLFAIGFGGLLWFLIWTAVPSSHRAASGDSFFTMIFFVFFMGIVAVGLFTGVFASAAVRLANHMTPIVDAESANPALAVFTFLFSPLAGIYTIGFFVPMLIMPLILMVIADVSGTGTVGMAFENGASNGFFRYGNRTRRRGRRRRRGV